MNIHEYQAKAILARYGINVPKGGVAYTPAEAEKIASELTAPYVVKAQIHAGGRGKAGGVKISPTIEDLRKRAEKMLGMTLVTHQTGPGGKEVKRLYIEEGCEIAKEYYFCMLLDRASGRIVMMASSEGGMDIEEVAAKTPEKIIRVSIDPMVGMQPYYARKIAVGLGMGLKEGTPLVKFALSMHKVIYDLDITQIEINPLVMTKKGEIVALDAKVLFDDNALFRHRETEDLRDIDEEDPMEREAARHELNYIKLDGNIGCMVNGAGLAMATMDIIKLAGGSPANFLDVGGGATRERVTAAFKLILSDPHVEGILVNIFGGIMRCDAIAEGIVAAAREVEIQVPLVVRLEGTNVELGNKILDESGLAILRAANMGEAAETIIKAVQEAS